MSKKKSKKQKKPSYYSQAFELDVELFHLHFLPRLQLKRKKHYKKRIIITANTASAKVEKRRSGSTLLYNMWSK